MELSKNLKKLMISGAALLMFASAGAAGVNNVNVSAKRRHTHVSRHAHITRHHKRTSRSNAPKIDGNVIKYSTGKVFIQDPQEEARNTQANEDYLQSQAQAHANDGTSWYYDPSVQSSLQQPAVPQQMISDPTGYANKVDNTPGVSQSTKDLLAGLTADPSPANDPDAFVYNDQGDSDASKSMKATEDANQQALDLAKAATRSAQLKDARKAGKSRTARRRAKASVTPYQVYQQAFRLGAKRGHNNRRASSRALSAALYAANHTASPAQVYRRAAHRKGVKRTQRLALLRMGALTRKRHRRDDKAQVNRVLQLLRARGDFKGMKRVEAHHKAEYLRKHPNALYHSLSRNNVGAVIYAKSPRKAKVLARRAVKKHPSLKKSRIAATSSKRNAVKLALFQATIVRLAKQMGIQMPQNGVFTINVK